MRGARRGVTTATLEHYFTEQGEFSRAQESVVGPMEFIQ